MKKPRKHSLRIKRAGKVGLPPGSLVQPDGVKAAPAIVNAFEYDTENFNEHTLTAVEIAKLKPPTKGKLWLNVHGVHDAELIKQVGHAFGLHPLVMEDIFNTDQRAKADSYDKYLYVVARCFYYDRARMDISSEQVSLVLGSNFLLSFQERPTGSFEPVRERMRATRAHNIRELGTDYLTYALLDVVVDRYFIALEQMGDDAELLEEELLRKPSTALLHKIHELKHCTLELRRAVWPLREVINGLIRNDDEFFTTHTLPYLRDVYDHCVHIIESLEAIRDLLAGMLDIYLSSISNRLNVELRTLTVVTMLFMPATLITGIFGMNFDVMPWLKNVDGFWWAIGVMLSVASVMVLIFWRRQWLSNH